MGNSAVDQLIEQAQLALRRLCEAPPTAETALAAIRGITDTWPRRPLRVGIGGANPAVRALVLDAACGGGVLAVAARVTGAPPLRVRRGPATRYRTLCEGAPAEEHVFVARARSSADVVDEAHRELARREHELAELERSLPPRVRVAPRWWAVWRWPMWWLRRWRAKTQLATREGAALQIEAAKLRVAELDARDLDRGSDDRAELARFFAGISGIRASVTEIELELADGPLGADVELIELSGAMRAAADVDAVLVASRDGVLAPVSGGSAVRVGDAAQVIRALPVFLVHARALNLARRARDRLEGARVLLDDAIDRAEAGFTARLARLDRLRVRDVDGLRAQQLEGLKSQILGHVGVVMEHASTHLGAELAKIWQAWNDAIDRATTTDQLKSAVRQIDDDWPAIARRIAEEVRVLVKGGLRGSVHDLYPELVAPLRELGSPERAMPAAPAMPAIAMLWSLSNPTTAKWGGAGEWFAGLFRSFATRRADIADKVMQRADHVRDVARAELLDAEPVLHAALSGALVAELDAAVGRHAAWLEGELERERTAIGRERVAVTSLQRIRERASRDSRDLVDRITRLEAELPGTAAASAAAALSVGSALRPRNAT